VSTADVELFGPPDADGTYPRFTTVLRGFDPDQVRDYILRLAARIEALETELEDTRAQRDTARKHYGTARDDAYNELGQRMADVLRMADHQADKIRREADEEAKQRVSQSKQLATQIEREADERAERLRAEGEAGLQRARVERDELLGGLTATRDLALADLTATRDHLNGIIERLDIAMEAARTARINLDDPAQPQDGEDPGDEEFANGNHTAPQAEDILTRAEGFDIMLPEFLLSDREDEDFTD
jgi:DivIVA domain-containing protein